MPDFLQYRSYRGLLTGINFYHDQNIPDLRFAVNDAEELHRVLTSSPYNLPADHLVLLTSTDVQHDQATRRNMLHELHRMAKQAQPEETLLFYYSGHGAVVAHRAYLCPSNTEGDLIVDTAIPLTRIREIVEASAARVKLLIFDACHLGARLGAKAIGENAQEFADQTKQVFRDMRGLALLASSPHEEISVELADKRHGLFTHYLLEALRNQATTDRNRDARLSIMELFEYVASRLRHHGQQPTILLEGSGDLVVFPAPSKPAVTNPVRRVFPVPVKAPEDFFGRSAELRRATDTLLYTSNLLVLVHGERCIGKTSFLKRLQVALREAFPPSTPCFFIPIEPAGIQTVEDFARELWDGLRRVSLEAMHDKFDEKRSSNFVSFSRFGAELEQLLQPLGDKRFIVFLDGFHKLWQITDDVSRNQLVGLIRYIVEQTTLPIAFAVSTLRPPELLWTSFTSPPPLLVVSLPPLDRGECDAMLGSLLPEELEQRDDLLAAVYHASGGHPYFAKLLAAETLDRLAAGARLDDLLAPAGWEQLLQSAAATLEATEVFKSVYERCDDDQRFVLLAIAVQADGVMPGEKVGRWRVAQRTAARKLEQRYYLAPLADGGYRLRLPLFGHWLRGWSELALESERLGVSPTDARATIRPGVFVNQLTGEVFVDGRAIEEPLPDLQFRALVYLVKNTGRVVSRDELYQVLHGADETYVATDQSLEALIYRLRVALGDRNQRYLKTVRRRGYMLTQGGFIA